MNAVATKEKFFPQKASYTIREAVGYLGMSDKSVRRLIERKLLRTSKALSKIHIIGEDVETLFTRTT